MAVQKVFKIRNEEGKFSTGGMTPGFTSRGKVWPSKGAMKSHLRQFVSDSTYSKTYKNNIPATWTVIEMNFETGEKIEYSAREQYPETKYETK